MPDLSTFDPAIILTAAGATIAAPIIASLIELIKKLPVVGLWVDAKREPGVAVLAAAGLVAYSYLVTEPNPTDPIKAFAAFVAFLGIAALASKAHDVAATARATMTNGGNS